MFANAVNAVGALHAVSLHLAHIVSAYIFTTLYYSTMKSYSISIRRVLGRVNVSERLVVALKYKLFAADVAFLDSAQESKGLSIHRPLAPRSKVSVALMSCLVSCCLSERNSSSGCFVFIVTAVHPSKVFSAHNF